MPASMMTPREPGVPFVVSSQPSGLRDASPSNRHTFGSSGSSKDTLRSQFTIKIRFADTDMSGCRRAVMVMRCCPDDSADATPETVPLIGSKVIAIGTSSTIAVTATKLRSMSVLEICASNGIKVPRVTSIPSVGAEKVISIAGAGVTQGGIDPSGQSSMGIMSAAVTTSMSAVYMSARMPRSIDPMSDIWGGSPLSSLSEQAPSMQSATR